MLKRLLVFSKVLIGVTLLIATVVLVAYQDHRTTEKYQRECQKNIPEVTVATEKKDTGPDKCTDPKDYMPWWYVLVAWPDGIAVWTVIATGLVIAWQSYETRKAAAAARLNVDALINIERPWLFLDYEINRTLPNEDNDREESCCVVKVVNRGKNYAEFVSYSEPRMVIVTQGNNLSSEPEYSAIRERYPHDFLKEDTFAEVGYFDEGEMLKLCADNVQYERLRAGDDACYVYGVVFYRDLLQRHILHELRWCLKTRPADLGMFTYMGGPDAYNRVT